jgi:hypothetical protein
LNWRESTRSFYVEMLGDAPNQYSTSIWHVDMYMLAWRSFSKFGSFIECFFKSFPSAFMLNNLVVNYFPWCNLYFQVLIEIDNLVLFNVLIEISNWVYSRIVILILSSNRRLKREFFHECNPSCIQYEWWEILMSCECIHLYMDDFAKNWLVKNLISLYKNRRENNK